MRGGPDRVPRIGRPGGDYDRGMPEDGSRFSDADLDDLDDELDRDELRRRYYGLLQELRVVLPGVQVLLAFLFAVPFAQRFADLDELGKAAFATSMVSAVLAVICFVSPTVLHRLADRTLRRPRLRWSIRLTMAGLALLAVSLVSALWCVTRFTHGGTTAGVVTGVVVAAIVGLWLVLPLAMSRDR